MRFSKSKYKVLHLGSGQSLNEYRLREELTERSPTEEDLGVLLVEERLDMSWQCALAVQKAILHPGLHQQRSGQEVEEGDCPPLLCPGESPRGVLHPGLGPPAQE